MARSLWLVLFSSVAWGQSRLLNGEDWTRIQEATGRLRWAGDVKAGLESAAEAWPGSHLARYGTKELALPPEGGQWWHWYVCPTTGVRLQFVPPNANVCPSDNRRLTGWPYDQVIYSERHDALANMARDAVAPAGDPMTAGAAVPATTSAPAPTQILCDLIVSSCRTPREPSEHLIRAIAQTRPHRRASVCAEFDLNSKSFAALRESGED